MISVRRGRPGQKPAARITTANAKDISLTGPTLSGSVSGETSASTAAGFKWGTSAASLTSTKTATAGSASFSATLSGLTPATTYYYQAYATVRGTEDHASETATFYGDVKSFITSSGAVIAASYSAANAKPVEARIVYGTSASSLTKTAYY